MPAGGWSFETDRDDSCSAVRSTDSAVLLGACGCELARWTVSACAIEEHEHTSISCCPVFIRTSVTAPLDLACPAPLASPCLSEICFCTRQRSPTQSQPAAPADGQRIFSWFISLCRSLLGKMVNVSEALHMGQALPPCCILAMQSLQKCLPQQ